MSFWTKRRFFGGSIPSKPCCRIDSSRKSSVRCCPSRRSTLSISLDHPFLATSFLIQTSCSRFWRKRSSPMNAEPASTPSLEHILLSIHKHQPRASLLKRASITLWRPCTLIRCCITIRVNALNVSGSFDASSDSIFRFNQTFSS